MDDGQVFVTIGGTAVPLQEAIQMAVGSVQDFAAAATASGAEAGAGLAAGAEEGSSALRQLADIAGTTGASLLNDLGRAASDLGGVFSGLMDRVGAFTSQLWAMTGGMVVFQMMNDAFQQVEQLTQGFFDLNNQMERNVYDWKYMYQSQEASGTLSTWMRDASLNMPFTQTDLMTGISNLAPTKLSPAGIEQFMPVIADIAASRTRSGHPIDLNMATQAIMNAYMGFPRMLKTELMINPEELQQYGLDATGAGVGMHINNTQTIMPSIAAWAQAQGLTKYDAQGNDVGAAYDIAHNTWWGEMSSWIDRVQNFQRDTGTNMFAAMKDDLDHLNAWWDQHKDEIGQIAKVLGTDLAEGVKAATQGLEGLFDGLKNSSLGQAVMERMATLAQELGDPNVQANIRAFGEELGKISGDGLKHVLDTLGSIKDAVTGAKNGFDDFKKDLSGSGINIDWWGALDTFIVMLGADIGLAAKTLGDFAKILGDVIKLVQDSGSPWLVPGDLGQIKNDLGQVGSDYTAGVGATGAIFGVSGATELPGTLPENQLPAPQPGAEWQKGSDGNWHQVQVGPAGGVYQYPSGTVLPGPGVAGAVGGLALPGAGVATSAAGATHPSGGNAYAPGRGGSAHNGTGFDDALGQAQTVATALASFTTGNPLQVQVVNPLGGPVTGPGGYAGSQYQYSYGDTRMINNFFGAAAQQIEQIFAGAMQAMQEAAGRAALAPGAAGMGASVSAIGAAVGRMFG